MVEKKTGLDWVLDILNTALLILIGLACLYPFWYVVCASFSDANEFLRHDFVLLLKPLKFSLRLTSTALQIAFWWATATLYSM